MNNAQIIGRITSAPELRNTSSNVEVCAFTLAVPRIKKTEGQPEADFINCVAFRNQALNIAKYVRKGDRLAVAGHISTRNYENDKGIKVYVTEIIVDNATFLEPKRDETQSAPTSDFNPNEVVVTDDDLPF